MIVIYTKHALERMLMRGITRAAVETALGNPDRIIRKPNHMLVVKRTKDKAVLIAYSEINGVLLIRTVISTSKLSKYLPSK